MRQHTRTWPERGYSIPDTGTASMTSLAQPIGSPSTVGHLHLAVRLLGFVLSTLAVSALLVLIA